ncbi:P-loop containing nucleoside triphosphate hydrolase protein [Dichotomocladium elegans]|nr:P-loop containing nucleoside triphosphate hydrolase protein [Dichotomocladium elegans]
MTASSSVRVAVRVRPLTDQEIHHHNSRNIISFVPDQPQIIVGSEQRAFTFDHAYPPSSDHQHVFSTSVVPLLYKFLDGYNATVLAYGQTGSGKTYSMGIGLDSAINPVSAGGIVPRFICCLFDELNARRRASENFSFQVHGSFLELYNEDLVDLLNPVKGMNLMIREDAQGNICWSGVHEASVNSPQELLGLLQKGSIARTTASTDMNRSSSRSHAIFSVILRQTTSDGQHLLSKFHFVDLAGSERLKRTNAVGDRAKEGISINAGLLALGNVISALGDESRKVSHIPYRDSKLTRLLQDSLGGNSQTLMLACVSPAESNCTETLNTLRYANRARNIRNRVTVNHQELGGAGAGGAEVEQRLKAQIIRLKEELRGSEEFLHAVNHEMDSLKAEVVALNSTIKMITEELTRTQYERDMLRHSSPDSLIAEYGKTIERLRTELAMTHRHAAAAQLPTPATTPTHENEPTAFVTPSTTRSYTKRGSRPSSAIYTAAAGGGGGSPLQNSKPNVITTTTITTTTTTTTKKRHSYRFGSKRSMRNSRINRRKSNPVRLKPLDQFKVALQDDQQYLEELDAINSFADSFSIMPRKDDALTKRFRACIESRKQLIGLVEQSHQAQQAAPTAAQMKEELGAQRAQYEAKLKKTAAEIKALKRQLAQANQQLELSRTKSNQSIMNLKTKLEKANQERKKLTKRMKQDADRARDRQSHYEREIQKLKKAEASASAAKKRVEREAAAHKASSKRATEEMAQLSAQMKQVALMLKKTLAQKRIDRQVVAKAMACASVRGYVVRQSLGRFRSAPLQTRVFQKKQLIWRAMAAHASQSAIVEAEIASRRERLLSEQRELLAERERVLGEGDESYMDDRITAITLEVDMLTQLRVALKNAHPEDQELDSPELAYQVALSIIRSLEHDESRVVAEALMDQLIDLKKLQACDIVSRSMESTLQKVYQGLMDMRNAPSDQILVKLMHGQAQILQPGLIVAM